MRCYRCGADDTLVSTQTLGEGADGGDQIGKRKRYCKACGRSFTTVEVTWREYTAMRENCNAAAEAEVMRASRAAKAAADRWEKSLAPASERGRAMRFDCPSCHAEPGEPCSSANGVQAHVHAVRRDRSVKVGAIWLELCGALP